MKVLNARKVRKRSSATQVYIGRPSKWGKLFAIGRDGTRPDVIAKYGASVATKPEQMGARSFAPALLVCWGAPLARHGDVLMVLADRR